MKTAIVFCVLSTLFALAIGVQIQAGVATVDATLPVGAPLAGYNHGERRVKNWPIPHFTKYTTFMNPSQGVEMTMWAKCVVLSTPGGEPGVALVTVDAIGADGGVFKQAHTIAKEQGFTIPFENVILSGSHSHSAAGAVSSELLWELAPATDIAKPELQSLFASKIAACLVEAQLRLAPAKIGLGTAQVFNATRNRRANFSPYVTPQTVDTQLGLIRIDDLNGKPLATIWNFAIHGTCLGSENMKYHGDVMGVANVLMEREIGGAVLFVNSDAGDIAPAHCNNWESSHILARAVADLHKRTNTTAQVDALQVAGKSIDFGVTHMNLTLARLANCTHGGYLNICSFCSSKFLNCHYDLHLGPNWIETVPKFTAARITINGVNTLLVTVPGEPINALGDQIKADAKSMGFDQTFVFGYSNNHMGYFTTPQEYEVGGYEGFMTFWGIGTSEKVRHSCSTVANMVHPTNE